MICPPYISSILASDLAEQVRSLTNVDPLGSPSHLHRHSRVLSWISESDDWQIDDAEAGSSEDDRGKMLVVVACSSMQIYIHVHVIRV